MFIARQKKKENIAEYLLYMWQIEDLIRANNLKMESIKENIIDHFDCSEANKKEMYEWYESLIEMMRMEGKQFQGHIQLTQNVIIDLTDLHLRLLKSTKEPYYAAAYYKILPYVVELRSKNKDTETPELEICFNALYGFMMLRLQHREISEDTNLAIKNITAYLSLLANYYKKEKEGDLDLDD